MTQQQELVKGLNELKQVFCSFVGKVANSGTVEASLDNLLVLVPIEKAINKAINKASETRVIPKQSAIKPSRS